jgi:serine phosphatase RsbU (regulator of sigma subunit)
VPEPLQLPPPTPRPRARAFRSWLTSTFAGRAIAIGALIKLVAFLLTAALGRSSRIDAFDSVGDIALVAAAFVLGYRIYVDAKRRLLWRVRRKLILSYIFIGVIPALLIVSFFLVAGALLFFNVSSFMLRSRVSALVDDTRFMADSAALELQRAQNPGELRVAMNRRQAAAASRHPFASIAVIPAPTRCAPDTARTIATTVVVGPWQHVPVPQSIPMWVACARLASVMTQESTDGGHAFVRAVAWPESVSAAVVVDVPFDAALARQVRDEVGITIGEFSTLELFDDDAPAGAGGSAGAERRVEPARGLIVGPMNTTSGSVVEPLRWFAFTDYRRWEDGLTRTIVIGFRVGPAAVYRYLLGPSSERIRSFSLGQLLLVLLAVIGVMFLIIQSVAFLMGLTLARSITGSVHSLFAGTERLRRGDFSHKITVRSRDQLGELAASFNSMSASIEDLLEQKAEKERLEEELRIARSIQMSLLPSGSLSMRGVSLIGHCEPAREVGGDYYDFLPLDESRMGILIADVAGKGTSAALYMAELKGLMLSLSQLHKSPRQLLIDANRIISKHLDARSFITMTYAVVDMEQRTLTVARAGHCPLVFVPGPHAASRAPQSLQPDGMVLGLALDVGDMFSRVLEELTLPLGRGDLFLLYTDGISEAMNVEGDCFGDSRLADLASQHADLTSSELRERILGEVRAFAGSAAQHDDMTMVLIKIDNL